MTPTGSKLIATLGTPLASIARCCSWIIHRWSPQSPEKLRSVKTTGARTTTAQTSDKDVPVAIGWRSREPREARMAGSVDVWLVARHPLLVDPRLRIRPHGETVRSDLLRLAGRHSNLVMMRQRSARAGGARRLFERRRGRRRRRDAVGGEPEGRPAHAATAAGPTAPAPAS